MPEQMTLRKAAEMALERLESHEYWMDERAIKALRQALAQPEQQQYITKVLADGTFMTEPFVDAVNMIQERVDETVKNRHEPVAWITDGGKGELGWRKTTEKDIPLYTAPPKREWVGLEDEELPQGATYEFDRNVRWAEAKLKEKNT